MPAKSYAEMKADKKKQKEDNTDAMAKGVLDLFYNKKENDNRIDKKIVSEFMKDVNDEQHLVYGWASVIEKDGEAVEDHQGDIISEEELVKAAHNFTSGCRIGKANHTGEQTAELVGSLVFTKSLQEAMRIDLKKIGWFTVWKVSDMDVWKKIKKGELKAFSIGGKGNRTKIA